MFEQCINRGFHDLKKSNINISKLEHQEQLIIIIITTQTKREKQYPTYAKKKTKLNKTQIQTIWQKHWCSEFIKQQHQ